MIDALKDLEEKKFFTDISRYMPLTEVILGLQNSDRN